jgi:hypothetical protein
MASLIALNTLTFTPASSILPTIIFYTSAKMAWSFSHSKYLIPEMPHGSLANWAAMGRFNNCAPVARIRGVVVKLLVGILNSKE